MSTAGWTKAEWHWDGAAFVWALDPERMCNRFSLHVQNDNRLATPQEIAANAQLAAAAPDLAEALQALVDHTRDECVDRVLLDHARAALKKAGAPNA